MVKKGNGGSYFNFRYNFGYIAHDTQRAPLGKIFNFWSPESELLQSTENIVTLVFEALSGSKDSEKTTKRKVKQIEVQGRFARLFFPCFETQSQSHPNQLSTLSL